MSLPWWVWLLLAVVVVAGYMAWAIRSSETRVRRALLAHLAAEHPEIEAREVSRHEIEIRAGAGEGSLYLHNFYREAALLGGDEEGLRELYDRFAATIAEGVGITGLDPGRDRSRVYPRLATDEFLRQVESEAESLPSVALGPPGLHVVFVLDSEASVAYLTREQLGELDLSPLQALVVAKENLREEFDCEPVRRPLADGSLSVFKSSDTYDAARLLLVPGCLAEGEELIAAIPDRDTLVLAQAPADDDWSAHRKIATTAAGEPLWTKPLRVTASGVSAVE